MTLSMRENPWMAAQLGTQTPCIFCRVIDGEEPAHVVDSGEHHLAFLDRSPLFEGHVLVVPRRHVVTLPDLPADLLAPLFAAVQSISRALPAALGAQGTFVAMNNTVSQSVAHLHVHVVPRTKGDGLRGFFWPRRKYESDEHAAATAARIAQIL